MRKKLIVGSLACSAGAALALLVAGSSSSVQLVTQTSSEINAAGPSQDQSTAPGNGTMNSAFSGRRVDDGAAAARAGASGENQGLAPVTGAGPSIFQPQPAGQHISVGPSIYEQKARSQPVAASPAPITLGPGPVHH